MLKLNDIKKDYQVGADTIHAIRNLNIAFRKNEFVSILGPSGCGKTTLLNIVGGLDQYTSGDLIIEGKSTKLFKDKDWDAYRNTKVGFVFQNYYLIPHQTVARNVEMALTLSGVSVKERKEKIQAALEAVGLADQINKRPNQLSGGQMQRVSIARALVNNPDIILADEPTGALDSNTSIQIMDLLAEIAKEKLVIMVTHNGELAKQYSTRIISLLDGEKVGDTNPYEGDPDTVPKVTAAVQKPVVEQRPEPQINVIEKTKRFWRNLGKKRRIKKEKTSMAFTTAIKLSFSNLLTKKARTIITSIAGSIGIIGVGLVLAISNGFSAYIEDVERSTLNSFPIMVTETTYDQDAIMKMSNYVKMTSDSELEAFPKDGKVKTKEATMGMGNSIEDMMASFRSMVITNELTDDYFDYLSGLNPDLGYVHYIYNLEMNVVGNPTPDKYNVVSRSSIGWQQLLGSQDFILNQYDIISGTYPQNAFETVIFVDKYNRIESSVLTALGIDYKRTDITLEELMVQGKLAYAENDAYYARTSSDVFVRNGSVQSIFEHEKTHPINIVGVMRVKPGIDYEMMDTGIAYTQGLVEFAFQTGMTSEVVVVQKELLEEAKEVLAEQIAIDEQNGIKSNKDLDLKNVLTGNKFSPSANEILMQSLLGIDPPKIETLCNKV
ncbi:MAG: ABC transporter ATP-binding protein, partial [Clostridia bacterium]|nr:ABC transporter ATP-binding protein [Clostridia bacterium]